MTRTRKQTDEAVERKKDVKVKLAKDEDKKEIKSQDQNH